jgi:hypothetical protein
VTTPVAAGLEGHDTGTTRLGMKTPPAVAAFLLQECGKGSVVVSGEARDNGKGAGKSGAINVSSHPG